MIELSSSWSLYLYAIFVFQVIQTVLFQEQSELDSMFASEPDAPEVCFIQEALQELTNRQVSLTGIQLELSKDIQLPTSGLLPPDVIFSTALNETREVVVSTLKLNFFVIIIEFGIKCKVFMK